MSTFSRMKAGIPGLFLALIAVNAGAQNGPDGILQALAVSPDDAARVVTSSAQRFYESEDAGRHWTISEAGTMAWAIRFGPNPERVVYAATQDHGVMVRVEGQDWVFGHGLTGTVNSVAPHPDGRTAYAGTDRGIYVSRDQGQNWVLLSGELGAGSTRGLVVAADNPQTIYASKWGQGVYRSVDGGMSWELGNSGLFDTQIFDLDIDPGNSSVLFASTWSGLFRSVDAGTSWLKLDSPSRTSELAMDPANSSRLIVVTEGNGIARSEDGGESWSAINEGLGGVTQFLSVAIGVQETPTVYAGSFREGLFVSNDFGDNWRLVDGVVIGSDTPAVPPPAAMPPATPPPAPVPPPPASTPPTLPIVPATPTEISIEINNRSGPEIQLGETARFEIVVSNTGDVAAEDVDVTVGWVQVGQGDYAMTARWPTGTCTGGSCNVGSLLRGQRIVISVEGHTGDAYNWVGPFQLTAWAAAKNASPVSRSARVNAVRTIAVVESGGGASGPLMILALLMAIIVRRGHNSRLSSLSRGA